MDYTKLEDLSKEHQAFLGFLDRAQGKLPPRNLLEDFAFLLDEVHHAKEEIILFPLLFRKQLEDKSGPKCINFFTPRVLNSCAWQDPFHALFEKLGRPGPSSGQSEFREMAFASGSMIRIPLEDHLLGEEAMARMLKCEGAYQEIFPLFAKMLREHIQREDECLFHLLRSSLSEEEKGRYAEAAAALDEKMGTASRLRNLVF